MSPLNRTLEIFDNFAVIHPNLTSWRHVLGGCTSMPGNFGEFRTGELGESGTRGCIGIRGFMGIRTRGLGDYQIHGT